MLGIRDPEALESCISQPTTAVFGEERFKSIHAKAAAYCYFIARLHPFFDGNKRAGLFAAVTFLLDHGLVPVFDADEMYNVIVRVATGECEPEELASVFEQACRSDTKT